MIDPTKMVLFQFANRDRPKMTSFHWYRGTVGSNCNLMNPERVNNHGSIGARIFWARCERSEGSEYGILKFLRNMLL